MDDRDSQNEYSKTSEESMNEEDGSEYDTRQERLRSPLLSWEIESGYQRKPENELKIKRSDRSTRGIRLLYFSEM